MIELGDMRWKTLLQVIRSRLGTPSPRFVTCKLDELQVQRTGCAKETAYRNWKALKEAEAEVLFKGAA